MLLSHHHKLAAGLVGLAVSRYGLEGPFEELQPGLHSGLGVAFVSFFQPAQGASENQPNRRSTRTEKSHLHGKQKAS